MRALMDQYGAAVKNLAARHGAIVVDTQGAIDRFLRHHHPYALGRDRVHPNATGHTILARTLLDALQFGWTHSDG